MRDLIIYVPVLTQGGLREIACAEIAPMLPLPVREIRIIKLPEHLYQIYYDIAQMCGNKERAKNDIRIDLMSWVRDKYPGHAIIGISDYSAAEAEAIKQKTGLNITWGMYVALEEGRNAEFGDISFMLQSPTKQIADGNHKTQQEITGEETSSP